MCIRDRYKGYGLSDDEVYGLALFTDEEKGKCALCHTFDLGEAGRPLFTDFTYDNLGVPKNPANPWYTCLLYTSPSPRDRTRSRMPSSA